MLATPVLRPQVVPPTAVEATKDGATVGKGRNYTFEEMFIDHPDLFTQASPRSLHYFYYL